MTRSDDARDHLAVVKSFMDGKEAREERRITRDLAARLNPVTLTCALASVLPHIAKNQEDDLHSVGVIVTRDRVLFIASSGWTSICAAAPVIDGARVTGDVLADSVTIAPAMVKQLIGFAGLTPKDAFDPQLEVVIEGTGPEKLHLRATDRTGLFEGKSITLPVSEPTRDMASAAKVLESMARYDTVPARTAALAPERIAAFVASAKSWNAEFDIEKVSDSLYRVRCGYYWHGLINVATPANDEQKMLETTARTSNRHQWAEYLQGLGQELVHAFR